MKRILKETKEKRAKFETSGITSALNSDECEENPRNIRGKEEGNDDGNPKEMRTSHVSRVYSAMFSPWQWHGKTAARTVLIFSQPFAFQPPVERTVSQLPVAFSSSFS